MFNQSTKPVGSLHVGELARKADVTPATVRYYTHTGLLHPGREPDNGYRCFSGSDTRRIAFIKRAQALGLTIGDIKTLLEIADQGEVPCEEVKSMVEQRLTSVRDHIAELEVKEERIRRAMTTWEKMIDPIPVDGELCPLIERLDALNGSSHARTRQQQRAQIDTLHESRVNGSAMCVPA